MMRGETEEVQRRVMAAVQDRDGPERAKETVRFFDTICGATQERQDALRDMLAADESARRGRRLQQLEHSHLAEMGEAKLPDLLHPQREPDGIAGADRALRSAPAAGEVPQRLWLPAAPLVVGHHRRWRAVQT
jgi:4-hydroxy-3-methylbut-2-enyl diphosphate reductase